jgi:uncharacterized protein
MSIYLDTSVLIPTLIRETASDAVEQYLSVRHERIISEFAALEVVSVLSRFIRTNLLANETAAARLTDFEAWRASTSLAAEVRPVDTRLAYAYVRRFNLKLRAPDALHVAIAYRLGATLVTLDHRLATAARDLGVAVDMPEMDTGRPPP